MGIFDLGLGICDIRFGVWDLLYRFAPSSLMIYPAAELMVYLKQVDPYAIVLGDYMKPQGMTDDD